METLLARSEEDLFRCNRGEIPRGEIRTLEIRALVDTGAFYTGLHRDQIEALGMLFLEHREILTGAGVVRSRFFFGAMGTLLGRDAQLTVMEIPDEVPPLIGVLLLEDLDLVVDPKSGRLIPNPAHGGQHIHYMLRAC